MTDSEPRFTNVESRCHCGGRVVAEVSETSPRYLRNIWVACTECPTDYRLEVFIDAEGSLRVKEVDRRERQ